MSPTNTSTVPAPPPSQPAPPTFAAWQNYEGSTGKIVTSARLNDFVNGAEMHVAFRSTSLGSMEVRAIVHEGSVGAEIHVEGGMSGGGKQNQHSGTSPSPQRDLARWDTTSQPSRLMGIRGEIEEVGNPAAGLSVRA